MILSDVRVSSSASRKPKKNTMMDYESKNGRPHETSREGHWPRQHPIAHLPVHTSPTRESYTAHLRQSSHTSLDNSYSPPSPVLRPQPQSRPRSAIYEHHSRHLQSAPRISLDRGSYDGERMMSYQKEIPPSPRLKSAISHLFPPP